MNFRLTTLLATLLAFVAIPSAPARGGAQAASVQGVGPGDQIRIIVYKGEEFSGLFTIAANGTIVHPLFREINVVGVPLSTVEDRIRTFLQKYQTNPQFVIEPLVRIIVGGEVRTPNVYSVAPQTTVAQAIALAGGPTDRASLSKVSVIRDRQEVRMDITRADSDAAVLQIRSGDQILIGRRSPPVTNLVGVIASSVAAVAAVLSILLR
jgi:polysaccharide biosynthesis/export protein VpsN